MKIFCIKNKNKNKNKAAKHTRCSSKRNYYTIVRFFVFVLLVLYAGGYELDHTFPGLEHHGIVDLREWHAHLLHGLIHDWSHLRHLQRLLLKLSLLGLLVHSGERAPLPLHPLSPYAAEATANTQTAEGKSAGANDDAKDGTRREVVASEFDAIGG